jgi:hypothetical protein
MIAESTEITEGFSHLTSRRKNGNSRCKVSRQLKRKRSPAGTRSDAELKVGSRYSYGKRALQRKEQNEDAPTKRKEWSSFLEDHVSWSSCDMSHKIDRLTSKFFSSVLSVYMEG